MIDGKVEIVVLYYKKADKKLLAEPLAYNDVFQ